MLESELKKVGRSQELKDKITAQTQAVETVSALDPTALSVSSYIGTVKEKTTAVTTQVALADAIKFKDGIRTSSLFETPESYKAKWIEVVPLIIGMIYFEPVISFNFLQNLLLMFP